MSGGAAGTSLGSGGYPRHRRVPDFLTPTWLAIAASSLSSRCVDAPLGTSSSAIRICERKWECPCRRSGKQVKIGESLSAGEIARPVHGAGQTHERARLVLLTRLLKLLADDFALGYARRVGRVLEPRRKLQCHKCNTVRAGGHRAS